MSEKDINMIKSSFLHGARVEVINCLNSEASNGCRGQIENVDDDGTINVILWCHPDSNQSVKITMGLDLIKMI